MMRCVYICAPLGGDVENNLRKAVQYTEYALRCGTAPVVSHFYAECLDDNDPEDRRIGTKAGLALLERCDEMWVFGEKITPGMRAELELCAEQGIPVRFIPQEDMGINEKMGGLSL